MTNYITAAGVQNFSITIASGNTTGTATINAVGSGAFIIWGGQNPSVASDPAESLALLTLTNSTTITATRQTGTSGTITVTGCIVDGDTTNLIKSVQYGTVGISSGKSGTATISAVTNANAVVHYLGNTSTATSDAVDTNFTRLSLSGTTVTATAAASGTTTTSFVVIEFQGSALNQSVQNVAASSSSSVTSFTASISSVNTSNAISFYGGSTIASVTTDLAEGLMLGSLRAYPVNPIRL